MTQQNRLKVLISAHEFSPFLGSECASGWNIITRIAKYHDVTLLYARTNQFGTNDYKRNIIDYFSKNERIYGLELLDVSQPPISKLIASINKAISNNRKSVGLSILYFWALKFWEMKVYRRAIQLNKINEYDVIHHFNHLSFREPGYLWKLKKPTVWGPTSGLSTIPKLFLDRLTGKEKFKTMLRNLANELVLKFNWRILKAINESGQIYYVTKDDQEFFSLYTKNLSHMLDMGCYSLKAKPKDKTRDKLEVLWVGRLDTLKALDILFYAVSKSKILQERVNVNIIGDGPSRIEYEKLADSLKLGNINWVGVVDKEEVMNYMQSSDVLVHTSLKEAASAVILESISAGLPVICHDAFGMHFTITQSCGVKIPYISPDKSIEGFKSALLEVTEDRGLLKELKKGAIKRAEELTWDSISERISNDYFSVIKKRSL